MRPDEITKKGIGVRKGQERAELGASSEGNLDNTAKWGKYFQEKGVTSSIKCGC